MSAQILEPEGSSYGVVVVKHVHTGTLDQSNSWLDANCTSAHSSKRIQKMLQYLDI